MNDKIKDGLLEWFLLFGSRAVPYQELADNNQFNNPAMLLDYAHSDIWYIIDTTLAASITDTIWQLTPAALELIKGK